MVPGWWQSWMTPTLILAFAAWMWIALRPAFVRLLYHLLCLEPDRFERTVFGALDTKGGRVKFRAYSLEVHAERVQEVDSRIDEALSVANANKDSLGAIRQIQDLHGASISRVQEAVKDIPQMGEAMTRISRSLEAFAKEMKVVNDTMIRLEERSTMEERRLHQMPGSPHRRATDTDDEPRR
jgi:hypothetical protein